VITVQPEFCARFRTAGNARETWTVAAADGARCARVRWEIHFLLTFEIAPFFCLYRVYKIRGQDLRWRSNSSGFSIIYKKKPTSSISVIWRSASVRLHFIDQKIHLNFEEISNFFSYFVLLLLFSRFPFLIPRWYETNKHWNALIHKWSANSPNLWFVTSTSLITISSIWLIYFMRHFIYSKREQTISNWWRKTFYHLSLLTPRYDSQIWHYFVPQKLSPFFQTSLFFLQQLLFFFLLTKPFIS
jgi:hypothetical protein